VLQIGTKSGTTRRAGTNIKETVKAIQDVVEGNSGYYEQPDEIIGCEASSAPVSEVSHLKSTAYQPLVSPPSDSSDEEVRNDAATASIRKPSTDGRRCSKNIRRDCPPVWFQEFAEEHAENEKAAREERKQHYDKMEKRYRNELV
jgi:hypothetical protein